MTPQPPAPESGSAPDAIGNTGAADRIADVPAHTGHLLPDPLPGPAMEDDAWHPLPSRGEKLAAAGPAAGLLLLASLAAGLAARWLAPTALAWAVPLAGLVGALVGARIGIVRHRRARWRLDRDGLALRRGRWWETETRVPASRVQHVDLKRGPLERSLGLATLVVHTAGVKLAAVSVPHLDGADAERLRDRLARQLDPDDDAL